MVAGSHPGSALSRSPRAGGLPPLVEDVTPRHLDQADLLVFHDESELQRRWFLSGILWVAPSALGAVFNALADVRARHGYYGEMHFSDLSKQYAEVATARSWVELFIKNRVPSAKFYVLGVDRTHRLWEPRRFGKRFHEYNRFTAQAVWNSYRLFFTEDRTAQIVAYSDGKSRRPAGDALGDGRTTDNFETYLPRRFLMDRDRKFHVNLTRLDGGAGLAASCSLRKVVPLQPCRPGSPEGLVPEHELLQLCDLMLGATRQAVAGGSTRGPKFDLGRRMGELVLDQQRPKWQQRFAVHGRFMVALFPGDDGLTHNNVSRAAEYTRTRRLDEFPGA